MANVKQVTPGNVFDSIFGPAEQATEQAQTASAAGAYLSTDEKNALYAARVPMQVLAVGERVSFRYKKPEWVLQVQVQGDENERRLTFEKNSAERDAMITKFQLFLRSPASKDHALVVLLLRNEGKTAKPWYFELVR